MGIDPERCGWWVAYLGSRVPCDLEKGHSGIHHARGIHSLAAEWHPPQVQERPEDEPDWSDEPTGSCDGCGVNLYGEEQVEGLCDQCSWARSQG
jgi:hypothetical protein